MTALLLDENLSEAILGRIVATFPGSLHVRRCIATGATDGQVWYHARACNLVLVTRDEDFQRFVALRGTPPKVVWLAIHNASNRQIVDLLLAAAAAIERFVADPEANLLVLG